MVQDRYLNNRTSDLIVGGGGTERVDESLRFNEYSSRPATKTLVSVANTETTLEQTSMNLYAPKSPLLKEAWPIEGAVIIEYTNGIATVRSG